MKKSYWLPSPILKIDRQKEKRKGGKKEGKRWKGMEGGKEEWSAVILVTMYRKL